MERTLDSLETITKTMEAASSFSYIVVTCAVIGGILAYAYIERKLHVAKSIDEFIAYAKKNNIAVEMNAELSYHGFDYYEGHIQVRAGKRRYTYDPMRCTAMTNYPFEVNTAFAAHYFAITRNSVKEELKAAGLTVQREKYQDFFTRLSP